MTGPGQQTQAPVVLHDGDEGARRYAGWLAEEFGGTAAHHDEADPAQMVVADTVVLFTAIAPGGGLVGSTFLKDNWQALVEAGRRVAVCMVGSAPLNDDSRVELMNAEFTMDQMRELKFFQLRGVVDPGELGFRQKLALRTTLAALRRKPELSDDEQRFLDSGGGLDLTDRAALGPLLRWIRREA